MKVTLQLKGRVNVNFKFAVKIEGSNFITLDRSYSNISDGPSYFVNIRVAGESGVFGVDPKNLPLIEDDGFDSNMLIEPKYQIKDS